MRRIIETIENKTTVRKWGNGQGVLLPKALVDSLRLRDAQLHVTRRGDEIILKKVIIKKEKMTLAKLIAGMPPRSLNHPLIDFGLPVGKEIW